MPKPERTPGNHRRYRTIPKAVETLTVGYVRASSHDQKEDLSDRRLPSNPKLENQSISSSPIWAADSIILQHQQGARGQLRCLKPFTIVLTKPLLLTVEEAYTQIADRYGTISGVAGHPETGAGDFVPRAARASRGHICRLAADTTGWQPSTRNPRNRNRGFPKRMNTPHLKIVPRPSSPPAFCKRARNSPPQK